MNKIKWTRKSGTTIETNADAASIAFADAQGWERQDKPRRGRPPGSVNKPKTEDNGQLSDISGQPEPDLMDA